MDTTTIREVNCSGCDNCETVTFNSVQEVAYLDDIMKELGWTRVYGYFYCEHCSQKGTVR